MTCTPEEPIFSTDVWLIAGGQATRIREIGVEGTKSRCHRQQGRRVSMDNEERVVCSRTS